MTDVFASMPKVANQPRHARPGLALRERRESAERLQSFRRERRCHLVEQLIRRIDLRDESVRCLLADPKLGISIANTVGTGYASERLGLGAEQVRDDRGDAVRTSAWDEVQGLRITAADEVSQFAV